ncbi:MAG: aminotransferase class IV, partial [Clostridia bacterium]|nr:aminotransferase class IV [Clostridia bacterium]
RFFSSMKLLGIEPAWTKEELRAILEDLVSRLDSDIGKLYWQASRGTAPRSHAFPKDAKANLLVFLNPGALPDFHNEISLVSVEDIRFEICNVKTLNLIPSVLATDVAMKAGCDEAVLHRGEIVTECAHSNISIIKNGVLVTHPADNFILPGTVRKHVLDICHRESIPVIERPFTMDELRDCDEAVVTASFSAVRRVYFPVHRHDGLVAAVAEINGAVERRYLKLLYRSDLTVVISYVMHNILAYLMITGIIPSCRRDVNYLR